MELMYSREEKVEVLLDKIKNEYEDKMDNLYEITYFHPEPHYIEPEDDFYKEYLLGIANEFVILNWIKINIIDKEGSIFKSYFRYDLDTKEAVFMVDDLEIEMMINSESWIEDFENTFYNHVTHLDDIHAQSIGKLMYSYIDRVMYKERIDTNDRKRKEGTLY